VDRKRPRLRATLLLHHSSERSHGSNSLDTTVRAIPLHSLVSHTIRHPVYDDNGRCQV